MQTEESGGQKNSQSNKNNAGITSREAKRKCFELRWDKSQSFHKFRRAKNNRIHLVEWISHKKWEWTLPSTRFNVIKSLRRPSIFSSNFFPQNDTEDDHFASLSGRRHSVRMSDKLHHDLNKMYANWPAAAVHRTTVCTIQNENDSHIFGFIFVLANEWSNGEVILACNEPTS